MELYSQTKDYTLYHGSMLDMLEVIEPNSIDSVVTDPPYELGFMGRDWDSSGIAFRKETWEKCYQVLKPGGYLLAFGGCYDEQTEFLTAQGWKLIKDATMSDDIVTLNPDTHCIELHKPNEVVKIPYNGEMYHFNTNKVDLMVTGNHKMYVATLGKNKYRLERADSCYSKAVRMKKNAINNNADTMYFILPSVSKSNGHYTYDTDEIKIPMDYWLKFFGLYMAQGSSTITGSYKVKLSHYVKEDLDIIEQELGKHFHICRYDDGTFNINNKELCVYLHQFGTALTKHLPDWLKTCSMAQIKIFIEWYLRGDGDRKLDRWRGYTSSKQLADDFQELALYAGISADISVRSAKTSYIKGRAIKAQESYTISFNLVQNEPEVYQRHKRKSVVEVSHRNDFVYCVEVPNHIIYVRRNGKSCWCGNTRTFHRIACAIEDAGFEIRDTILWLYGSGMPKSMNISKGIEAREKYGVAGTTYKKQIELDGDGESYTVKAPNNGLMGEIKEFERKTYSPQSDLAKQWDGWGTALKPAYEPVIVARKPCEGSCIANVMKYGVGGINIDECKIGSDVITTQAKTDQEGCFSGLGKGYKGVEESQHIGRFPSNVILTYDETDYEEVCGNMPQTNGGTYRKMSRQRSGFMLSGSENNVQEANAPDNYGDSGSASRYFYSAKATTKDRDEGLDGFNVVSTGDLQGGRKEGSAGSLRVRDDGSIGVNPFAGNGSPKKNIHPTVKPTTLMQYLIRLVSPKGSVILDPFNGSGSTGKACMWENRERDANYKYIGIELTDEYLPVADARISYAKIAPLEESKPVKQLEGQVDMFDLFDM